MKHIVKTEKEWLKLRSQYVTASEAAVLVGADPYSSPSKIRNPSVFTGNSFTKVGQMLEPVVVNVVNAVMGTTFKLYENDKGHKEFYTNGILGATPDAHQDRKILLEAKTTRPHTYIKYSAVPPSKYLIQQQTQMYCTRLEENYLAIMSTNLTQATQELIWPISIFKVKRDKEICRMLSEEAYRFKTSKTFRVDSKIKQKIKLLLTMCYERVV